MNDMTHTAPDAAGHEAAMPLGEYYLRLLLSRWKLVTGIVSGCTLLALAISTLVLANDPQFESAARLNIVPTAEELGYANRFVRGSTFDGGSVLLQTYAEFAHTRPIVGPIVDRYIAEQARAAHQSQAAWIAANSVPNPFSPRHIYSLLNYGDTPPLPLREDMIQALVKNTTIETVEGTYLMQLTVQWDDPVSAAWLANALADAIIARAEVASHGSGAQIASSLTTRLISTKAALADTLRRARALKAALGVVDIDRQKQSLLEAQLGEESQLTSDRAALRSSESQVAALRAQTGGKLSSAQPALEQALAVEGPRASGLQQGIAIREGRVRQIDGQIATIGRNEAAVKALDDQAVALQTEVTALTERVGFSETENVVNGPRIQLIERAIPPATRSSPKTLLITALGFVAGCALAGCLLLLIGPAKPRRRAPAADAANAWSPDPAPLPPQPTRRATDAEPAAPSAFIPGLVRAPHLAGNTAVARDEPAPAPVARPEPILRIVPPPLVAPPAAPSPTPPIVETPDIAPLIFADPIDEADGGRLVAWLAETATDARPLIVAGMDGDGDAQALYRLLHRRMQATGAAVRILDATTRTLDPVALATAERKPLVYAGGFGQSGDMALLSGLDEGVHVVIAVPARHRDGADQLCLDAHRQCAALLGRAPHIVAMRA